MSTILIRLREPWVLDGHQHQTAEILDLDAATASALIAAGRAKELPRTPEYLALVSTMPAPGSVT